MARKRVAGRPKFIDALNHAYRYRRQNVFICTGRITDLFWNPEVKSFVTLEQELYAELQDQFTVLRLDMARGVSFYDSADKSLFASRSAYSDTLTEMMQVSAQSPLAALVLVKGFTEEVTQKRRAGQTGLRSKLVNSDLKPLAIIVQYAGSIFPEGEFSRLSELDRQRLVFLLDWINSPKFTESAHIIILIAEARSEINAKIISLPITTHIEIELPDLQERTWFTEHFISTSKKRLRFEGGKTQFFHNTAGLSLSDINMILEAGRRTNSRVKREDVINVVDERLRSDLGEIVTFKKPEHTPDDIIGYSKTRKIFESIFRRCEDPETAIAAIIVSGPNGSGKTFQLEAYAAASGRVVIELAGLRGQYFGQTDRFFEMLRWNIRTFGKILILMDEAHTAFGSVHAADLHATERRLAGNIIKMMGDPAFLGKVLWGLMTSRPDQLDPDIKSRAPIQIPILDPEGKEREEFVREMFRRKGIVLNDAELREVLQGTDYYSPRDYRNLVAEVLDYKKNNPEGKVVEVLEIWQVSRAIEQQRRLQTLIAAEHCSYPQLLTEELRSKGGEWLRQQIETLKRDSRFM